MEQKTDVLVEDFIKKMMEKIDAGMGDKWAIDGPVNFELSLAVSKETQGGFNIKILDFSLLGVDRKLNNESAQIVQFSVVPKNDPSYEAQQLIMTKIKTFLDQPNEKLIEMLSRNSPQEKTKIIDSN